MWHVAVFLSLSFLFFFPNMQFHDIFLRVWYYKRLEWDWQHETQANDMIWTRNVVVCFLTAQPTGCPWANYFIAQPYGLVRLRLPRLQMWQTLFVFLWHYFSQLINRNLICREYMKKKKENTVVFTFICSAILRWLQTVLRVNDFSVFAEDYDVKVDIWPLTSLNNIILLDICVKLVKFSEFILEPKMCIVRSHVGWPLRTEF